MAKVAVLVESHSSSPFLAFHFSVSISPSNEYSGLISFRIDWFDLFAVQETLKSLLQHHSSKASILRNAKELIRQGSYWLSANMLVTVLAVDYYYY